MKALDGYQNPSGCTGNSHEALKLDCRVLYIAVKPHQQPTSGSCARWPYQHAAMRDGWYYVSLYVQNKDYRLMTVTFT